MTTPEPDPIAKRVAEIKSEFDLGGHFGDRSHTERAEQLLDALADQLRAALAATPEPVTGATQDPRVFEVAAELAYPGIVQDRHEDRARILLMRADEADAAAGIRRVPAADFVRTLERLNAVRAVMLREGGRLTPAAILDLQEAVNVLTVAVGGAS